MKLIPSKKSQPEPTNGNAPVTKAVCLAVHAGLDKRLDKTDETLIRVESKLDRVFEHIATHRGARDDD